MTDDKDTNWGENPGSKWQYTQHILFKCKTCNFQLCGDRKKCCHDSTGYKGMYRGNTPVMTSGSPELTQDLLLLQHQQVIAG
jgi:hypothetical protein